MKPLFAVLLLLFVALPAHGHPGKTDRYGGHQCYKECAEWDLYYAEYHLHDKAGRPVKVVKKKQPRSSPTATLAEMGPMVSQFLPTPPPVTAVPQAAQAVMMPDEPGLPLIWILLALFLLLFLVVRRKRKEKIDGNDLPSR